MILQEIYSCWRESGRPRLAGECRFYMKKGYRQAVSSGCGSQRLITDNILSSSEYSADNAYNMNFNSNGNLNFNNNNKTNTNRVRCVLAYS